MKDGNQQSVPTPGASTPFFARFLENQHSAEAPSEAHVTLKYPSDRDEGDVGLQVPAEAATAQAGPSRMTLKYPSDRDEIDNYAAGPSGMTLKYPSDRDEIDNYSAH